MIFIRWTGKYCTAFQMLISRDRIIIFEQIPFCFTTHQLRFHILNKTLNLDDHTRNCMLFLFDFDNSALEATEAICETYGENAISNSTCLVNNSLKTRTKPLDHRRKMLLLTSFSPYASNCFCGFKCTVVKIEQKEHAISSMIIKIQCFNQNMKA
jgi:hypothetical protein